MLLFVTGFGRFDFFTAGVVSFGLQYCLDRIFITYWYDPQTILSDPTNSGTMTMLKFIPGMFMVLGFYVMRNNQCSVSRNLSQDIQYPN